MKILYIDCAAGISGDMTLGALLDLGVPEAWLRERLALLGVGGWRLSTGQKMMRGIACTDAKIELDSPEISEMWEPATALSHDADGHHHEHDHAHGADGHHHEHDHTHGADGHHHEHDHTHGADGHHHEHDHAHGADGHHHDHDHVHGAEGHHHEHDHSHDADGHHHEHDHAHDHRTWADIRKLILASRLDEGEKELAIRIFLRIATAEAAVHGTDVETVAFHEVGAVDSIVDIVGVAICLAWLKPDRTIVSPVTVGSGFVRCRHGILPVPAPATARILTSCHAIVQSGPVKGELTTPTGAAILAGIADEFGALPRMRIERTGLGSGKKDFGIPNVLRLMLGESVDAVGSAETAQPASGDERIWMLEANIDDMSGEIAGHVLQKLLDAGARDCFHAPVYMKKNRPGVLLSVLADEERISVLEELIFRETSTIGIRRTRVQRSVMSRTFEEVELPEGLALMKVCSWKDIRKAAPEYEILRALSERSGRPLIALQQEAMAAWLKKSR